MQYIYVAFGNRTVELKNKKYGKELFLIEFTVSI